MQWEGQELQTQLFSPNGAAQEVPVSQEPSTPRTLCPCTAFPIEKKKKKLSPPRFLFSLGLSLGFAFSSSLPPLQDLLTSALLSEDGHKATYHLSRRGVDSPLQVCFNLPLPTYIQFISKKKPASQNSSFIFVSFRFCFPQQLGSWEQEKCGKTEEHIFAAEQSHKYLNTYSTRTLVM